MTRRKLIALATLALAGGVGAFAAPTAAVAEHRYERCYVVRWHDHHGRHRERVVCEPARSYVPPRTWQDRHRDFHDSWGDRHRDWHGRNDHHRWDRYDDWRHDRGWRRW